MFFFIEQNSACVAFEMHQLLVIIVLQKKVGLLEKQREKKNEFEICV
jgi:hypothetical protein